jgi:predicted Zn-dependent protease
MAVFYKEDLVNFYDNIFGNPCDKPITYNIGRLDTEFGMSKEEFLSVIKEAEKLWEDTAKRDLFQYSKDGDMAINLVFDERQAGTIEMNEIDKSYQSGKKDYESLKAEYQGYVSQYESLNSKREAIVNQYNQRLITYEKEVARWNKKSAKVPADVYNRINNEKSNLEAMVTQIKSIELEMNKLVVKMDSTRNMLNLVAGKVNSDADMYNEINHNFEEEFEQGVYISNLKFREINIYQYDNHDKLVRVLAHEMGHALGIGHLDNEEDIMYSLNIGKNTKITQTDLDELDRICSKGILERISDNY